MPKSTPLPWITSERLDRARALGLIRLLAHWYHNKDLTPYQRKQLREACHFPIARTLHKSDDLLFEWTYGD